MPSTRNTATRNTAAPTPTPRSRLEYVAERDNHGVILRSQATDIGMTKKQIDRRVRRGQWVSGPARGGLILAKYATNPLSILAATTTTLDAIAWGRSAVALWQLTDHPTKPTVASIHQSRCAQVRTVRINTLAGLAQTTKLGIETITLEVALASMAISLDQKALDHLIDEAIRQQLTTWERVQNSFVDFATPSRRGSTLLRKIISERSIDSAIPLSDWSRDFANKLASSGLARPRMEHRVMATDGSLIAQVDLAYPDRRYAIELDSVQFHLNRSAFETDRRRDADLAQVGWRVSRFTWSQFRHDWDWVTTSIRAQLNH